MKVKKKKRTIVQKVDKSYCNNNGEEKYIDSDKLYEVNENCTETDIQRQDINDKTKIIANTEICDSSNKSSQNVIDDVELEEETDYDLLNYINIKDEILRGNCNIHVNENKQTMYRKIQLTDLQGNPIQITENVDIEIKSMDDISIRNDIIVEEAISNDNQITKDNSQVLHMRSSTCDSSPAEDKNIPNGAAVEIEDRNVANINKKFAISEYPSQLSTVDDEKGVFAIHDMDEDGPVLVTWENKNIVAEGDVATGNSTEDSPKLKSLLIYGKIMSQSDSQIDESHIQNGLIEKINSRPLNTKTDSVCTYTNNNSQGKALETNGQEGNDNVNERIYKLLPRIMRVSDHLSLRCMFCDVTYENKQALIAHLIEHTGKKPLVCSICKFVCLTPNALEMHKLKCHSISPRQIPPCNHCSYECATYSAMKNHKISHAAKKSYLCKFCPYRCSNIGSLWRHTITHTGEKYIICDVCNEKFGNKNQLYNHLKKHRITR